MDDKEGMKLDSTWVTSNGVDYYKNLVVHKCTDKDRELMYPANDNFIGQIDVIFTKLFCLDPNEIELKR